MYISCFKKKTVDVYWQSKIFYASTSKALQNVIIFDNYHRFSSSCECVVKHEYWPSKLRVFGVKIDLDLLEENIEIFNQYYADFVM